MRPCVLIVDDDEPTRALLESILRMEGHHVVTAAGGREALERMHAQPPPDLVLLDLMMPGMGGWEVIDTMRTDPRLAQIPVVLLTAFGDDSGLPPSPAVLHKPVDEEVLRGLVGALLAQDERLRHSLQEPPSDLLPRPAGPSRRSPRPSP